MAIQQGNVVCVMGCPKSISTGVEGLFNFQVHEAMIKNIFIPNIFLTNLKKNKRQRLYLLKK